MNWKKILRSSICLLVVLAILLNCVPVKADAVVLDLGFGLIGSFLLDFFGFVFSPNTVEDIVSIGNSFSNYLRTWGENNNLVQEVNSFLDDCLVFNDISVLGVDDFRLMIPETIASGIAGWTYAVLKRNITFESSFYDGSPFTEFTPLYYATSCTKDFHFFKDLSSYDLSTSVNFDGSFDGQTLELSTKSSKDGCFTLCSKPFMLSEGYYYFDGGTMTSYHPQYTYTEYCNFNCGVVRYDPSDGTYRTIVSYEEHLESGTTAFPELRFYASPLYDYYFLISGHYSVDYYDEFMGFELSKQLELVSESSTYTDTLEPSVVLGDYYGGVHDGSLSEEDFFCVGLNLAPILQGGSDILTSMQSLSNQLTTGSLTLQQYQEMVDFNSDYEVGTGELVGTLGQFPASSFWEKFQEIITAPFLTLKEGILSGIRSIFVPSQDYLTAKVDALASHFPFVVPVVTLARTINLGFNEAEPEPPIIYLHLEDTRGSYDLGGTVPFIDMTWYAEYKPIGDALLSSLLWVVFIWRLFRQLPGLIAGMPGEFNARILDVLNVTPPSRSMATEVHRQSIRESIRTAFKNRGGANK